MRAIEVSTDVFQAIWAAREPGEEDEDTILRRKLGISKVKAEPASATELPASTSGWTDARAGVLFPEGFEVFRNFKGRDHRAKVVNGRWHLNGTPINAATINQLSNAAGIDTENGWMGWNYTQNGQVKKIANLRPASRVHRRNGRIRTIRTY